MKTPNLGPADLVLGNPHNNTLFEFSSCHGHYHFKGFAHYRLLDLEGHVVTEGNKQSFALMDVQPLDAGADGAAREHEFRSEFQGISAGWADVYGAGVDCQWIDVTDVVPGEYVLEATVNPDHVVDEADYENNQVLVPLTVPANTCPGGCRAWSDDCCREGDPCGLNANGACDCGGIFAWDEAECHACVSDSPDCQAPFQCWDDFCANGDPQRRCDEGQSCLTEENRRRTCAIDTDCKAAGDTSCPTDFCVDGDAHRFCDRGKGCSDAVGWKQCPDDRDCPTHLNWRACPDDFCQADDPGHVCDEGTICEDRTGHVRDCRDDPDCWG
jgi:hypothetical protein